MKLADYLKCHKLSAADFAERISVHETTVYRYLRGERIPNRDTLERILGETKGEVTANDFFSYGEPLSERRDFVAA
ncbi:MAG TPA: helix-turn-helix transcriptional regulator [Candidatus Binatia bacterium]|nr:helix-turn-helix transcriptional regulator [Candidatus Binatia bacterium]